MYSHLGKKNDVFQTFGGFLFLVLKQNFFSYSLDFKVSFTGSFSVSGIKDFKLNSKITQILKSKNPIKV